MNAGQKAAIGALSATLIAVGYAAPRIAEHEGWVSKGYYDSVGVKTRCLGSTKGAIVIGKEYSPRECMDLYAEDLLTHGLEIAPYLPAEMPPKARAAFIETSFNIGTGAFAKSSMSRKAMAGDLRGACEAIGLYVYAQGRDCRIRSNNCYGVVTRRESEKRYCLAGLAG